MATVTNYPIDLPILVIEAQIFVAVKKFPFLPNKLIPSHYLTEPTPDTMIQPFWRYISKSYSLCPSLLIPGKTNKTPTVNDEEYTLACCFLERCCMGGIPMI